MINLTVNRCGSNIYTFSDHTLSLFCNPELEPVWRATAAKGIFSLWDDQMVSDYLNNAYLLQGDSAMTSTSSLDTISGYLRMFPYYTELAPTGSQHAAERAQQTAAILKIAFHIKATGSPELRETMVLDIKGDSRDYRTPYINNEKLRGLLLNSEYDREAVLNIVLQRGIYDGEHVTALLATESHALGSGLL
jgi:hypothetical protein